VPEDEDIEMRTTEKIAEKATTDYKFNSKSSTSKKKSVNYGLDDLSDKSETESDSDVPKINKKKAVSEYKDAINCFGRKNLNGTKCFTGKKAVDKVIITETEYNINVNDWLINDIEKKATTSSNSIKRKLKDNLDDISIDDDLSNLSFEHNETRKNNNNDDEYIDEILEHNLKSKKSNSKRSEIINSPISKRRNIENTAYNSDAINKRNYDIYEENDSQSSSSSLVLSNFNKINEAKSNNFKKSKGNIIKHVNTKEIGFGPKTSFFFEFSCINIS
jgi:hypothetical protein